MMEAPPPQAAQPVMYQHWNSITFLYWRYPPAVVQSLLPPGLTAETSGGAAWLGLTPFLMERVGARAVAAVPWLSRFGGSTSGPTCTTAGAAAGSGSSRATRHDCRSSWPPARLPAAVLLV